MANVVRPTKKQRELLVFIADFIAEHGYSPSYREVMNGCNYNSVATVALHIRSLIARGHLAKRGRSARSLEVIDLPPDPGIDIDVSDVTESQEKWLVQLVGKRFIEAEAQDTLTQRGLDELYVLVGALRVLELNEAANAYIPRLGDLKIKVR